jgi:DNA-directed RNA polymerase subunit RPC12/RpoP
VIAWIIFIVQEYHIALIVAVKWKIIDVMYADMSMSQVQQQTKRRFKMSLSTNEIKQICDTIDSYYVCGHCGEELTLTRNGYSCTVCGFINALEEITVENLCNKGEYITTQIIKPMF